MADAPPVHPVHAHPAPAPSLNDIQRKLSIHSPPALSPRPSLHAPEPAHSAAADALTSPASTTSATTAANTVANTSAGGGTSHGGTVATATNQTVDSDADDAEERVEGARTLDRQAAIKTGYLYKKGQRRKVILFSIYVHVEVMLILFFVRCDPGVAETILCPPSTTYCILQGRTRI